VTSSYPVMSIWLASQNDGGPLRHRGAESALVSRPFFAVETRKLQPGTGAFLSALKIGSNIGGAIAAGSQASQHFSAAEALATLIGANIAIVLGGG
jgi:hypothetical protein